jgi:hypothetical protein
VTEIRLTDVVLLSLHFRMWPDPPAEVIAHGSTPFAYPEGDVLTLAAATERDGGGLVLYLQAEVAPEDVETLVRLCYPFLRETVANVTGQSPAPPYYLPQRLPQTAEAAGRRQTQEIDPSE